MNTKYIVRDGNGHYQSAYNLLLGEKQAFEWARQCARSVKGDVFFVDDDKGTEKKIYGSEDPNDS